MEEIDQHITKFISKHHVMTIATVSDDGSPRSANLFYAYNSENAFFVFTSSLETSHGRDMSRCERVGANIVLETSNIGRIEGLQIEGVVRQASGDDLSIARSLYIKRFPFAIVADLELWILRADRMKMTNNKLGFGKKIVWTRGQK